MSELVGGVGMGGHTTECPLVGNLHSSVYSSDLWKNTQHITATCIYTAFYTTYMHMSIILHLYSEYCTRLCTVYTYYMYIKVNTIHCNFFGWSL